MLNNPNTGSRFSRLRKLWKPAVATGAGGTTLFIWFEEIIAFGEEFIGVILLAVLGGLVCIFDDYVFKPRIPRREDLQDTTNNNGVKK